MAQETKFTNNAKIKADLSLADLFLETKKTYVATDLLLHEVAATNDVIKRLKRYGP